MELKHTARRVGRLSSFLKEEMGMSTGLMNRLKWQDKLFVDGVARHTDFSVVPGNVITVELTEPAAEYPAEEGELTVLYEDDALLAVDKPAGMLIHPSRATMTGTLANRVLHYYRQTGQDSVFHPVTRLDRDTFGVVLLAKNAHIHALLNQENIRATIQKTYHALVFGGPECDRGVIDAPIARRPLPSLLRYVDETGKPSRTEYEVLVRNAEYTKLRLRPVTGRTHQLRVHCAHAGFPILGDPQYGNEQSRAVSEKYRLHYQQLCAKAVSLRHPVLGTEIEIISHMDAQLPGK